MDDTDFEFNSADVVMPSADTAAVSGASSPAQTSDTAAKPSKREQKTCERCGVLMQRRVNIKTGHVEGVLQFAKRRFCGHVCAGLSNNNLGRKRSGVRLSEKTCENCGKMFGQRIMPNGNLEYPAFYKTKRFCTRICASIGNAERRRAGKSA